VTRAAGDDPRRYDGPPSSASQGSSGSAVDTAELPTGPLGFDGYPVGGANRSRMPDTWER
jgi:hypothetical protein